MGEIFKDISKRVATLCLCRQYWPDAQAVRECMQKCEYWGVRSGGWCEHYVGTSQDGSQMCTHLVERKQITTMGFNKLEKGD